MGVNLEVQTLSEDTESVISVINQNFRRVRDGFQLVKEMDADTVDVTGSQIITTGLNLVNSVVVSLASIPTNNACFVSAQIASASEIEIFVYTNAFALSGTTVTVNWLAMGE